MCIRAMCLIVWTLMGVAVTVAQGAELSPEKLQLAPLAVQARNAFEKEDYQLAIGLYTKLLGQAAGRERQQALEMLGVSRELNRQLAHAKNHYIVYLQEYPDTEGALRVEQRLAGLLAIQNPRTAARNRVTRKNPDDWKLNTYFSQFYQRQSLKINGDSSVPIDGIFSNLNMMAAKKTGALENEFRVTASYIADFTGLNRLNGREYQVSSAYWQGFLRSLRTGLKVGRQSRRGSGVPGRFDGAVLSYKPSATMSFDLTGGYLIDSSFNSPDTNRPFVGVSGEYVNQSGNITIEPFLMQQYVDGILDRRALGVQAELRFDQAVLYTLVDYDIHHSALNNATLMGNFRIGEMRVSTSFAHRKSPYLTTRNALIGQLSVDLSELEEAILDIKLKDLADDRTATSNTARVSLTSNVSEHWLISTEVAASSFSKTESSIDIVGLDSYKSIYSSFQIRTTDIFGAASYTALTLRRADTDSGSTSSLFLDNRINMGKHWRVYPRVRLDLRDFDESDDKQWTMNPSIRLDYKHGQRFRFQAEAGYTWVTRGMVNQDLDISGVFFRLGYSASF